MAKRKAAKRRRNPWWGPIRKPAHAKTKREYDVSQGHWIVASGLSYKKAMKVARLKADGTGIPVTVYPVSPYSKMRLGHGVEVRPHALKNPATLVPSRWTRAQVMRTARGQVKIKLPGASVMRRRQRNPTSVGRRDVTTGLHAGEHWYVVLQYGHDVADFRTRKQADALARKLNREDPKSARVVHVRPHY